MLPTNDAAAARHISCSFRRAEAMTLAPSRAIMAAIARPIPLDAPTISTTWSFKETDIVPTHYADERTENRHDDEPVDDSSVDAYGILETSATESGKLQVVSVAICTGGDSASR
jgi:hypothetical protein